MVSYHHMKKVFSAEVKGRVALEAIKEMTPISQLAQKYEAHPNAIGQWKKIVQDTVSTLFTDKRRKENQEKDDLINRLYTIIGKRDTELEWVKKKLHLESS